ncbi:MAG: caspase family protein [Planctomycetota bacterium]
MLARSKSAEAFLSFVAPQHSRFLAIHLLAGCAAMLSVGRDAATAAAPDARGSRPWAVLIGVEGYTNAPPLSHTNNDVHQLAETLCERGGFGRAQVLEMIDAAPEEQLRPTRENIVARIAEWLKKPESGDSVLLYFSGHGLRDEQGKLYLAPLDCNPSDLASTGIAVEWLRDQLASCRGDFKLLVLDSCHAGSEKGSDFATGVTANELGEPFRELSGVVTLASSTADQKSQIWPEKRQSLFSYWFNQGLKGHADENGDSLIDIDELNKYVHRNVSQTARSLFPRQQTPVRIVRAGTPGVPVLLRLEPLTLKQVLSDMAEQLAYAMQERRLAKVGVLEFTNDTKIGELLGADFGVLGRYCATELQDRLTRLAANQYTVVGQRRLQSALQSQQMTIDKLASPTALKQLSEGAGGMPAIALGTLRSRAGRVVNLQCTLMLTADDAIAGVAGGTALLNESEWAMLGRSVVIETSDRPAPGLLEEGTDLTARFISRLDDKADGPHPMSNPNAQFRASVVVGGQPRKPTFKGNDMYVPVRKGETYEVWIENLSDQVVMLRLLVDGLNTLPQEEGEAKGIDTYVVAPRVNLDDARAWVLDPKQTRRWAIRGFVTETGAQGKLREFKVVDADASLAARRQFTDDIGIITAAFYSTSEARGGTYGTGFGAERGEDLTERNDRRVGNLLSVIHIRYVDPSALGAPGGL